MVLISGFYVRYHSQIALPHFWRAGRRAFWPSPAAWTRQRKAPLRGAEQRSRAGRAAAAATSRRRRSAPVVNCSRNTRTSGCRRVVRAESTHAAWLARARPQLRQQQQ